MGELKNELKEIRKKLDELSESGVKRKKKKPKEFKLPMSSRVNPTKAKQNYITLLKINENGHITFKRVQIKEQAFFEDKIPRLASAGYVMYYKKNPMIILPSWSVQPLSISNHYKESLSNGSNTKGYSLLMHAMKSEQISSRKAMGGMLKWIIGLTLAGIVVYALFTGGG